MPTRGASFGGASFGGGRSSRRSDSDITNHRTRVAASPFRSSSITYNSPSGENEFDFIRDVPRYKRCELVMRWIDRSLETFNQLHFTQGIKYNKYLVNCPNVPDLKKLSEKEPKAYKNKCELLLREREALLASQNQELSASQNAFFNAWLEECPDAA